MENRMTETSRNHDTALAGKDAANPIAAMEKAEQLQRINQQFADGDMVTNLVYGLVKASGETLSEFTAETLVGSFTGLVSRARLGLDLVHMDGAPAEAAQQQRIHQQLADRDSVAEMVNGLLKANGESLSEATAKTLVGCLCAFVSLARREFELLQVEGASPKPLDVPVTNSHDPDYTVTIKVSVTAGSAAEAAQLALDDLREPSFAWNLEVTNHQGSSMVTVAAPQSPSENEGRGG
jgi:hypothetical protein